MKNPFESLNKALKADKKPEKRMIRHPKEREIIDIALNNLSQSEMGAELVKFVKDYDIKISVLRGKDNRDYSPSKDAVFISVGEDVDIEDPEITIHLAGAIRETYHEYDQKLRRLDPSNGESIYVHREQQKFEDKLLWETAVVYELGKIANKTEFIDSFTVMGYYSLIDAYEKDLMEN
jgi:hypothetical protein